MKKIIFMLLLVSTPFIATAETTNNDTIVIKKPRIVTIITGDSIQKIVVKGKEDDYNYDYRNTIQLVDSNYVSNVEINKDSWSLRSLRHTVSVSGNNNKFNWEVLLGGPLLIGFTAPTKTATGTEFSTFHSWEFALPFISINQNFDKKEKTRVSLQTFFNWRNYRTTGNMRFVKHQEGKVLLAPYPAESDPNFSRIKVFSISGALMFCHRFNKDCWGFDVGPVVNLNVKSSIKNKWETDGVEQKQYFNDIHVNPVTVDFICMIKFGNIGVYGKYSPCSMLDGKYGLKYKTFSFGLYL